ncbi:MAG: TonB-dependent receptor [Pseudomonadota bacterium]
MSRHATTEKEVSLKSCLLAGAAATALVAAPGAAFAESDVDLLPAAVQDDVTETDDVVVVTGIKRSIADSLSAKKEASSIIEAVSAEDIGKLPDVSIADTLARLPGLTAQRVRGRSQSISIRGLGPDFSISLLNGREQVSAGDNRGIEFDQYPSELIAQGIVYKTPDASLAASGIAGTVDLKTVKPLDFDERRITVSGQYLYNDNGELNPDFDDNGYRLFASYIDQNETGTLGWSIAVTTQSIPNNNLSRELKTSGGQTRRVDRTDLSLDEGAVDPADPNAQIVPIDNPRTGVESREFERTSVAGTLQWRPSENFSATIDAFYSDFEDSGIFRGAETPLASWAGGGTTALTEVSGSGPVASSATYANVNPVFRTDVLSREADLFSGGVNLQYDVTESLKLTADLSTSQIDRTDTDFESYAGFGNANSVLDPRFVINGIPSSEYTFETSLDYSDPSVILLTDPGGWGQVGFIKRPNIEDELYQYRAEAEQSFFDSFLSAARAGVIFTTRDKSRDGSEEFIDFAPDVRLGADGVAGTADDNELELAPSQLVGLADFSDFGVFVDPVTGATQPLHLIAYDPNTLLANGTYVTRPDLNPNVLVRDWEVNEELLTFYAMADIDTEIGTMPLRGNIGFQYIDVSQESTGARIDDGNFSGTGFPISNESEDYDHFLPSVNLGLEFMPDTFVKVAYARTVTRPRMNDLRNSQTINRNALVCPEDGSGTVTFNPGAFNPSEGQTCFSANGGNIFLRPFEADAFDVSFEKYFGEAGAFSIAFFNKQLDNYVLSGAGTLVDISDAVEAVLGPQFIADNPDAGIGALNAPVNAEDGHIRGFEVALRMPLDEFLPPVFEGLGFNISYSNTDAQVELPDGSEIDIPGFSEDVYSGDVYYERNGVRARVNVRHRSEFLAEIEQFDGTAAGAFAEGETIVDAQIGYTFQGDGPLRDLSFLLEVYNLTDEPFQTFERNDDLAQVVEIPSRREDYGRLFQFRVAKSF